MVGDRKLGLILQRQPAVILIVTIKNVDRRDFGIVGDAYHFVAVTHRPDDAGDSGCMLVAVSLQLAGIDIETAGDHFL